jgi:hypothetical protein
LDKEKELNENRDWMKLMLSLDFFLEKFVDVFAEDNGFEVSDFKFTLFPISNFNTNMNM